MISGPILEFADRVLLRAIRKLAYVARRGRRGDIGYLMALGRKYAAAIAPLFPECPKGGELPRYY